jgi:hypothetical protein
MFSFQFSTEADGEVSLDNRYRIVGLRIGEFSAYCGLRRGACPAL